MKDITMLTKAFPVAWANDVGEDGAIEGYASVFDVLDSGMDIVAPGAFTKTLGSGRRVKMLWQHEQDKPIGVWEEIREDERGLFVKGRILSDVQRGREALALLRAGAIDGISIGYRTVRAEKAAGGARKLVEIDLFEASIVTFPMLEVATVTAVKSITTEREFERFLRDAGWSRKEAAAITLHGFKGLTGLRDADSSEAVSEGEADDLRALFQQLRQFEEQIHG